MNKCRVHEINCPMAQEQSSPVPCSANSENQCEQWRENKVIPQYVKQIDGNVILRLRGVNQDFGNKKILCNINLDVSAGEIVSCVGPSGSGKSTFLQGILGTQPFAKGEVLLNGKRVLGPSKNIGIVYQNYPLYDYLTVRENVAFGLKLSQTNIPFRIFRPLTWRKLRKQQLEKADAMLKRVDLLDAKDNYPSQLSGGMRQRVVVAQAMIMEPEVLLMDEPFGAQDIARRQTLQLMLQGFLKENLEYLHRGEIPPHTIIIVTHELEEALFVSTRIIGISQFGFGDKLGSRIVYDKPSPVFKPNDPNDFKAFVAQREEIAKIVMDENYKRDHANVVQGWSDVSKLAEESHAPITSSSVDDRLHGDNDE